MRYCHATATFVKSDGSNYFEAHHLIPICKQAGYKNSLDVAANLICVCPNCHRRLHLGKNDEVQEILKSIYDIRAVRLANSGIEIGKDAFLAAAGARG